MYILNNIVTLSHREIIKEVKNINKNPDKENEKFQEILSTENKRILTLKADFILIAIIFIYVSYSHKLKFLEPNIILIDVILKSIVVMLGLYTVYLSGKLDGLEKTDQDIENEEISRNIIRESYGNSLQLQRDREEFYKEKSKEFIKEKTYKYRKGR
ncbi:hypothetical protein [Facklamia sp. P12950]|uniref:hypothetical protein n=1 Tax=Facklamia sp. P12950 TaxID=3421951 RepID=UPI003D17C2F5